MDGLVWLMYSSFNIRWPILVFSSYILEGWIMLHLLMCSSFIGRVAYTGLYLVVLLYSGLC